MIGVFISLILFLGSLRSSAVFSDEEPEKKKEFNFIPPNLSERILAYNIHILVFIVIVFVYVNRPLNDELFLAILAHYFRYYHGFHIFILFAFVVALIWYLLRSHIPTHKYSKFGLKDVVIKNIVSNYSKKMATIPVYFFLFC